MTAHSESLLDLHPDPHVPKSLALGREVDHVGFSGSRLGMSEKQLEWVEHLLRLRITEHEVGWFHHGGCIGSDTQAHWIAQRLGYKICLHPPLDDKFQEPGLAAFCDSVEEKFSYNGRNQRIVLATKYLIATPHNLVNRRGGTWNAIEHAERIRRPRVIIYRNGTSVHLMTERIGCHERVLRYLPGL